MKHEDSGMSVRTDRKTTSAARRWGVACVLVFFAPLAAAAGSEDAATLTNHVLEIFQSHCAKCHSPAAKPKPKKFNFVLDLPHLSATPKYVLPGYPEKSLLWTQLDKNEMPPEEEDDVLKPEEKETVKRWIAAGCPPPPPRKISDAPPANGKPDGPSISAPKADRPDKPGRPFFTRLVKWLGNFHPLAAHTPIALTMAAAIAEMLYLKYRAPALTGASRFSMVLGAMGALATGALGWLMAIGHTSSELLENHRWAGTIAAAAAIPIAILGEWGARRAHRMGVEWHGPSRWTFRIAVFAIAGLVGFAAHLGGLVHWGEDFFNFPK
jgi:mono/diheme cytochrome c family protein/uncharacterized membrane protein